MVFAVLGVLAIAGIGTWWSTTANDKAARVVAVNTASEAQPTTEPEAPATAEPEAPEEQITHVTFGSHTQATQPCVTCHPDNPTPGSIVCRDCHENVCGKDAKTVADCLECHQTGTTTEWSP